MRAVVRTEDSARRVGAEIEKLYHQYKEQGLMVTVEPYQRPGTNSQKAKIHAMLADLADETGHDRRYFKEICKREYWPVVVIKLRTGDRMLPKSTADLTTEEAGVVIEKLYHVASELNIQLKDK